MIDFVREMSHDIYLTERHSESATVPHHGGCHFSPNGGHTIDHTRMLPICCTACPLRLNVRIRTMIMCSNAIHSSVYSLLKTMYSFGKSDFPPYHQLPLFPHKMKDYILKHIPMYWISNKKHSHKCKLQSNC